MKTLAESSEVRQTFKNAAVICSKVGEACKEALMQYEEEPNPETRKHYYEARRAYYQAQKTYYETWEVYFDLLVASDNGKGGYW